MRISDIERMIRAPSFLFAAMLSISNPPFVPSHSVCQHIHSLAIQCVFMASASYLMDYIYPNTMARRVLNLVRLPHCFDIAQSVFFFFLYSFSFGNTTYWQYEKYVCIVSTLLFRPGSWLFVIHIVAASCCRHSSYPIRNCVIKHSVSVGYRLPKSLRYYVILVYIVCIVLCFIDVVVYISS